MIQLSEEESGALITEYDRLTKENLTLKTKLSLYERQYGVMSISGTGDDESVDIPEQACEDAARN